MARLDKEKQELLEPKRRDFAIDQLSKLGYETVIETNSMICFSYKGSIVHYYPYSGRHTGKTIIDGRGWKHLYDQVKPEDFVTKTIKEICK